MTAAESSRPRWRPSRGPTPWPAYWAGSAPQPRLQPAQVNGYPALIIRLNGEIDTVTAVRIDGGLITGLYAVRNPEKLAQSERETTLRR